MRFLLGLALILALGAAMTAGGFAVFNAFRGRRLPTLAWSVLAVAVFAGQCSASLALRPVQLSASHTPPRVTQPSPTPPVGPPVVSASPDPCRRPAVPTSTALPVGDFGRILSDPSGCRVFVSSPSSNSVIVLDYGGNTIATITDEFGAGAMVVSGSILYVALDGTGSIDEIDLHTLARIKTLASGLVKPADLALAGGRLWTTTGNCADWSMGLVGIDPSSGAVIRYDPDRSSNLGYCAAFATGIGATNQLVAWDVGLEPANITTFDVSSGVPVMTRTQTELILGNLQDAVVTPGSRLVTASGAPYEFDQWRLSDLQQDGVVYPGNPYPVAVAIAAGRIATGVGSVAGEGATVRVFALDKPAPLASMLPSTGQHDELYRRGLAMSPDGRLVFAVTGSIDPQEHTVTFNVLPIA